MWSQLSRLGNQRLRAKKRETGGLSDHDTNVKCLNIESDTCILWIVNKLAKAAPRRSRVFSWCWLSKRWQNLTMSSCFLFPLLSFCPNDATKWCTWNNNISNENVERLEFKLTRLNFLNNWRGSVDAAGCLLPSDGRFIFPQESLVFLFLFP